MPAKPSLTILPFVNLAADPGQDIFSDGLTLMDVKLVWGEAARLVGQSKKIPERLRVTIVAGVHCSEKQPLIDPAQINISKHSGFRG